MLNGLYKIVSGKAPAEAAGPIGVAQMAGQVAEKGMLPLITLLPFEHQSGRYQPAAAAGSGRRTFCTAAFGRPAR